MRVGADSKKVCDSRDNCAILSTIHLHSRCTQFRIDCQQKKSLIYRSSTVQDI